MRQRHFSPHAQIQPQLSIGTPPLLARLVPAFTLPLFLLVQSIDRVHSLRAPPCPRLELLGCAALAEGACVPTPEESPGPHCPVETLTMTAVLCNPVLSSTGAPSLTRTLSTCSVARVTGTELLILAHWSEFEYKPPCVGSGPGTRMERASRY